MSTYGDGFGYNGVRIYSQDTSTSAYRPVLTIDITSPDPEIRKTINIVGGSMRIKGGKVILK